MKKASDVRKALCYAALMEDNGVVCNIGGQAYVAKRRKNVELSSKQQPTAIYQVMPSSERVEIDYDQFEKQVEEYAQEWMKTPYVKSGDAYFEISDYGLKEVAASPMVKKAVGCDN